MWSVDKEHVDWLTAAILNFCFPSLVALVTIRSNGSTCLNAITLEQWEIIEMDKKPTLTQEYCQSPWQSVCAKCACTTKWTSQYKNYPQWQGQPIKHWQLVAALPMPTAPHVPPLLNLKFWPNQTLLPLFPCQLHFHHSCSKQTTFLSHAKLLCWF
jgi:hypothetical protein